MKKIKNTIWIALAAAVMLAACQPAAAPASLATTATPAAPTGQPTTSAGLGGGVQDAMCLTDPTIIPPPGEDDYILGDPNASITVIEYSDLQCPYCAQLEPVMTQFLEQYPGEIRFVYRHFPLSGHDKSQITAQAAEAAGLQGKYYEMIRIVFASQDVWAMYSSAEFEDWVLQQAEALELDLAQFRKDMKSEAVVKKVQDALQFAVSVGIPGTPFLVINGVPYQGARDPKSMYEFGKSTMSIKKYADCPPMAIDENKEYTATLETAKGNIVIKLLPDIAPVTVNSFVFLAREGWFNGMTFHRVIPGFVAQTGDPSGTGTGGPGYRFGLEVDPSLNYDRPGLVGMARTNDPNSNGSQFFITFAAVPSLNQQYTIFGEVVEGMDVAEALTPRDPQQGNLPPGDVITKVTISEK